MTNLNYLFDTLKIFIENINVLLGIFNLTLFNVYFISAVILLSFAIFRDKLVLFSNFYAVSVNINSESNVITVIPEWERRIISGSHSVDIRYEFNLSFEQTMEIVESVDTEIFNNVITVITDPHIDYIMWKYIIPIMQTSEFSSFFDKIFNHFGC